MLFVVGGSNEDNIVATGPYPGGSGWEIAVRDSGQDFDAFEQEDWSFLYIPFSTPNLIGGRIGPNGEKFASSGNFSVSREFTGTYRLQIPDASPETGMLLLSIARLTGSGSAAAPEDNLILYETSGNAFLIHSLDLNGMGVQDTEFVFAFIDFNHTPSPRPVLTASNVVAGETSSFSLQNIVPGGKAFVAFSFIGGGPTETPWGLAWLSPPWMSSLVPFVADEEGSFSWQWNYPAGMAGRPIWLQALDESTLKLSNDLFLTIR
jgi:hypothetical protein